MNEEPNFTGEPRFPRFKCFDPTKRQPRFKQSDRVVYMLNSEPKFCGTVTQVNEHQGTTESNHYYTYHILFDHGMDAKWVNEFWLMPCEDPKPEKAAKALAGAGKPTVSVAPPIIACPERSDLDKFPDGIYFIAGGSDGEINTKTYAKYDPSMTAAPFPTKYIGIKLGHRTVAVALEDLPGDCNGDLQLLPSDHTSPEISEHYSWDDEADKYRFNAFEDFDGKGNTERLKGYGSKIEVSRGEWIPSMGELGLLMMHATDVNRAIELAGGKPIKGWHWSSTEVSQYGAWFVGFSDGNTINGGECNSYAVRAVTAF